MDKELKEAVTKMDHKIEDLRKASMNEINRLEAMFESNDSHVKLIKFSKFETNIKHSIHVIQDKVAENNTNINKLGVIVQQIAYQ